MNRSVITSQGLEILNTLPSSQKQYWIGYYGLAYIPEENRELSKDIQTLVPKENGKPIGDELFNIFQGSMADTVAGFDEGDVDSAAGKLYRQCLYAENIESTFRYSLATDAEGNKFNTLVTYSQDSSAPAKYNFYKTYIGVGGTVTQLNDEIDDFGLPIPAPLYYHTDNDDLAAHTVSPDMRNYAERTNEPAWLMSNDSNRMTSDGYASNVVPQDKTVSAMESISNFNRYHAPSSSEGYPVAHDPACRNMSKVTKYFPIDHYDLSTIIRNGGHIQNLEAGKSSTNLDNSKVGSVKYKIAINIADYMKKAADRIVDSAYELETSNHLPEIGFKFNRIGLYAVPVTLHAFNVIDSTNEKCGGNKVQLSVDGDAEPVLFAVIDTDTIEMSETGLSKYSIDFSVVFQENTSLVNNPVIYYNLYENDSITWYKNQLIANASISEAVTMLGVEMNYIRNMVESIKYGGNGSQCGIVESGNDSYMWAFRNHTHPYVPDSSASPIIINDCDIPYIPNATPETCASNSVLNYQVVSTYLNNDMLLTIFKDGKFHKIPSRSWNETNAFEWDYGMSSSAAEHFSFGTSNRLIWNTWLYYVKSYNENNVASVYNRHNVLYVNSSELYDGVVYEIVINLNAIGRDSNVNNKHSVALEGILNNNKDFVIRFSKDIDHGVGENVYKWADANGSTLSSVKPNFHVYVPPTSFENDSFAPLYNSNANAGRNINNNTLSSAVVHFTKVDGKIYVMAY